MRATFDHQKINYLALMMVDPHVHFHVIPRYSGSRELEGATFVRCRLAEAAGRDERAVALAGADERAACGAVRRLA